MLWWLKWAGAALTTGAGALIGLELAGRWSRRPRRLAGFRTALTLLETEMVVGRTPLPEAAERVAALAPDEAARFFRELAEGLRRGLPASEAWRRAVSSLPVGPAESFPPAAQLRREERADLGPLSLLGEVIGLTDLTDQLKHLQLARERLGEREREASAAAGRFAPLCRYLGLAVGLLVALLLI